MIAGGAESLSNVPILRPKLPAAERLVDYLRQIDASRYYSNFGPLACTLEDRLAHIRHDQYAQSLGGGGSRH